MMKIIDVDEAEIWQGKLVLGWFFGWCSDFLIPFNDIGNEGSYACPA